MIAVEFDQVNIRLAEDQPEYETLPVFYNKESNEREMVCCFQLNKEEIDEIVRTGKLWHTQCTYGNQFHPVSMTTQNPFINTQN